MQILRNARYTTKDGIFGKTGIQPYQNTKLFRDIFWRNFIVNENTKIDLGYTGSLTYLSRISDAVNLDAPRHVYVSPDGRHVYSSIFDDDAVAWLNIDNNDNDKGLSYVGRYASSTNIDQTICVIVSHCGRFAYVSSARSGRGDIAYFTRNTSTGELTYQGKVTDAVNYNGALQMRISFDGRFLYVSNSLADSIAWFTINVETGEPTYTGIHTDAVLINYARYVFFGGEQDEHVYLVCRDANCIAWYTRNVSTGDLTYVDRYSGANLSGAYRGVVTPNGKWVYVACYGGNILAWFSRNGITGELTYVDKKTVTGASDPIIDITGKWLYVTCYLGATGQINWFRIDQSTGEPIYVGDYEHADIFGSTKSHIEPFQDFIYLAARNSDALAWFKRDRK